MVEDAEQKGLLKKDSVIIEPTSGNTGIGLAMVAAVKGYKLVLVMPESMSIERRRLMSVYGAGFELTPREKGMKGAIEKAKELLATTPGSWMPQQFDNSANIDVHVRTTAQEILNDFQEGIDFLITGVGTGGHITGVGEVLKTIPGLKVFAVEPELSPVISGGAPVPTRYKVSARVLFRITYIRVYLTGRYRFPKKKRLNMHNVPQRKKEYSREFPAVPPWQR